MPGDETIESNTIIHKYNSYGEEVFSVDSFSKKIITERDYKGRVLSEKTQSLNSRVDKDKKIDITKTYNYNDGANTIVTEVDGNNNIKTKVYDYKDRLISDTTSVKEGDKTTDLTKTTEYLSGDLVSKTTDQYNNTTIREYDAYGRLVMTENPNLEIVEKLTYYLDGNQKTSTDAVGSIKTFNYDKNKRLIETIDGEGNSTKQDYDSQDNISKKIEQEGNETIYGYDLRNRLLKVETTGDAPSVTEYTYDENNNLIKTVDGAKRVKENTYNAANSLKTSSDILSETTKYVESFKYYPNGALKEKTDKNNNKINYEVDDIGREIKVKTNLADGTLIDEIVTTYDNNNNAISVTKKENGVVIDKVIRSYDSLNRVKTKEGIGKNVSDVNKTVFSYDKTNNVDSGYHYETTVFGDKEIKKVYDKVGRVVQSVEDNNATNFAYYPNGNKKSMVYANSNVSEEYEYNKNNLLIKLVNKKGEDIVSQYSYEYNGNNKLESKTDGKGKTTYTYDKQNRLKTVVEPTKETSYTYDGAGNRLTETISKDGKVETKEYVYNEANRLNSITGKDSNNSIIESSSYSYDNNGNMINEIISKKKSNEQLKSDLETNNLLGNAKKIQLDDFVMGKLVSNINYEESRVKYSYDIFNNMVMARDTIKDTVLVENKYNSEGLRINKKSKEIETKYIYEGQNPIIELDVKATADKATFKAINEYVGDIIVSRTVDNEKYNYLYNGHGDVVNLIDTNGKIENTYYYDAFGVVEESFEEVSNSFKYSKYEYDEETSKYYIKSRMYDPVTARFMQEDTYKGKTNDPLSLNLYTYCVNEPLMYYDPDGHAPLLLVATATIWLLGALYSASQQKKETGEVDILTAAADGAGWGMAVASVGLLAYSTVPTLAYYSGMGIGALKGLAPTPKVNTIKPNIPQIKTAPANSRAILRNSNANSVSSKGAGNPDCITNKGYKPQPGERTFEGYVKNNVTIDKETKLYTNSSGFNTNPKNMDNQFKRFGVDGHGPQLPEVHVHQPTRNVAPNGTIYGGQGTKPLVDVTLPGRRDVTQLYEYLNNGKYQP